MQRVLAILAILLAGASARAQEQQQSVHVDERVELLTIVARLAGAREFTMPNSRSPYSERVEARFGPARDHPAIAAYQKIRKEQGASHDAIASLALHLDGVPSLVERMPFEPRPQRLDARWTPADTKAFLVKLRDFAAQTKASEFFASERPFYEKVEARLAEFVTQADAVPWFDKFFGTKAGASYVVIPGLLCGGGNYGVGVVFPSDDAQRRTEEIRPVLGCWIWDDDGVPRFDEDTYLPTYVHELCHSYTNPIVDRHFAAFESSANRLYQAVAPQMQRMAYGSGKTVVYESMVRACVVRYLSARKGDEAAKNEFANQIRAGFSWIGDLSALLQRYSADRTTYPTLDAFMPKIAEFFSERATMVANDVEARKAKAPKLVSMTPTNGARDVAPDLDEMTLVFDRPMRANGWSFVGSKENLPEFNGSPEYGESGTTLTVKIRLQPGKTYRFGLNGVGFTGFAAADGTPLEPIEVTFSVKDR